MSRPLPVVRMLQETAGTLRSTIQLRVELARDALGQGAVVGHRNPASTITTPPVTIPRHAQASQ